MEIPFPEYNYGPKWKKHKQIFFSILQLRLKKKKKKKKVRK